MSHVKKTPNNAILRSAQELHLMSRFLKSFLFFNRRGPAFYLGLSLHLAVAGSLLLFNLLNVCSSQPSPVAPRLPQARRKVTAVPDSWTGLAGAPATLVQLSFSFLLSSDESVLFSWGCFLKHSPNPVMAGMQNCIPEKADLDGAKITWSTLKLTLHAA